MLTTGRPIECLVAALTLGFVTLSASAQGPQVFTPENDPPTPYVGPNITAHPLTEGDNLQRYRVFLPTDESQKPCAGWPVLIHFDLAGFLQSNDFPQISTAGTQRFEQFLALVLQNNVAVVTATGTPTAGEPTSAWQPPAPPAGGGKFHPPEQTECPANDYLILDNDAAEKDAVMVIQHVRHHAGDPTSPYAAHMLDLDRTRVAVHGGSAGAIALMWPSFGPGRAGLFDGQAAPPVWDGQYDEPTRPDVAVLREGLVWWPAQLNVQPGRHFSDATSCATAQTLGNVGSATLQQSSALWYEQTVSAQNDTLPTYLYYKEAFNDVSCLGQSGTCTSDDNTQVNIHSAWHGMMWWGRHQNTRLALATEGEDADPFSPPGTLAGVYQPAVDTLAAAYGFDPLDPPATLVVIDPGGDPANAPNADIVAWLDQQLDNLLPNPWTGCWILHRPGVGFAPPPFGPSGTLGPTGNVLLPVSSAPPGTDVEVWISAWPATLADNGCGELIVNPDLVIPLQADGSGRLTHAIRWVDLPSQVANVFQVIVTDSNEPCGFSITETWIADTHLGS